MGTTKHILIVVALLIANLLQANDLNYGLALKSYNDLAKDRTSLALNKQQSFPLTGKWTITFDLFIRKETAVFGTVMRLVSDSGESMSLNFSPDDKDNRYPSLTVNDNFYPLTNCIEFEKWLPVSLQLSIPKDSIYLIYNNIQKSYSCKLNDWKNVKISFGVCPFPGFESFDSAPVNIKNIRIYEKEKLTRSWDLKEHDDAICYDLIKGTPAIAKNPQWLIDSHANWTKIYSRHFSGSNNPQYAYNQIDDLLYIVPDEKSIIVYNPVTNTENIIPVKAGYPAGISTNALIYDSIHNELISYSLDERTLSRFSFQTRTWSKKTPCATETRFWHHTASYNPKDTSLVTFGGYGYYKYKNDCFKINLNNNTWDKNNLLTITPRYSSASAIVDNCLYVFGGRGSETGKQEVNPHCRYDFYRIDLASNSVELLWNSQAEINFLPCGNMIFNTGDSCFYVLTNLHNGVLFRINSREPELTPVSAGINQNLMADFAFYTLFYSSQYQKLYSLFATNYKAGTSDITFYEMDYPPLSQLEISQTASGAKNYSYNGIILIVAAAIVLLFLIFYLSGRNKRKKSASTGNIQAKTRIPIRESIIEIENIQLPKNRIFDRSKQCISLLGGFNVWDKNGEDITPIFTPILKSLLLLILLYSEQESKGINDKKIDNILWPDKDDKAARNNRNVSLTRLKTLLENVGDVSLINNNGFWKIAFDGNVFCDYHAAIQSIKAIKNKEAGTQMQTELIELLMYGPLLPYTQTDWTDKFKSSYSNDAIDILYNMLIAQEIAQNEELCLQIADTIFLFDSLNEEALKIKCSILYHAGKKGLAKAAYDIFVKEYRSLLGENYKYTLSQLLGV